MEFSAFEIILSLCSLVFLVIGYAYKTNKRATDARIKKLETELNAHFKSEEESQKYFWEKIEKHYAYKSDIFRLDEMFKHFEKDLTSIKNESHRGNELLSEVLVELRLGRSK